MSAMMKGIAAGLALLCAVPVAAIGLGPLERAGVTDGDRKAFRLTLINPYPTTEQFMMSAIDWDDETATKRVSIFPEHAMLGANKSRQILVIVRDLTPGETYKFRVCGARDDMSGGAIIHARVCSKLTARRLS